MKGGWKETPGVQRQISGQWPVSESRMVFLTPLNQKEKRPSMGPRLGFVIGLWRRERDPRRTFSIFNPLIFLRVKRKTLDLPNQQGYWSLGARGQQERVASSVIRCTLSQGSRCGQTRLVHARLLLTQHQFARAACPWLQRSKCRQSGH